MKRILFVSAILMVACSAQEEPDNVVVTASPAQPASTSSDQPVSEAPAAVHRPYDGDPAGLAEIKLIDAQDDPRGWCVDLFAHRGRAQTIGGMQGHNCFMYFDIGSPTEDQGFDIELFAETGQFEIPYFDACMTLYEPSPGSFVAADPCTDEAVQTFEMTSTGLIQPQAAPDLCLTLGAHSVPGGGRLPPPTGETRPPANNDHIHLIRRLTFETCSDELADLQRWEFRYSEYEPDDSASPHRFIYGNQ